MDISSTLNTQDAAITKAQVDAFNQTLGSTSVNKQSLGKDDFLKLLVTQLTTQDPTDPMNDRDFISQMAQFSTLEQMTNMSAGFTKLAGILSTSRALSTLGKVVDIDDGNKVVTGVVEEVAGREAPRVLVNGQYYDFDKVESIRE